MSSEDTRPVVTGDPRRAELRRAIIAGATDCPMTPEEASAFMGRSLSWLRASDIPRTPDSLYLKSEILKYVSARLSHHIEAA